MLGGISPRLIQSTRERYRRRREGGGTDGGSAVAAVPSPPSTMKLPQLSRRVLSRGENSSGQDPPLMGALPPLLPSFGEQVRDDDMPTAPVCLTDDVDWMESALLPTDASTTAHPHDDAHRGGSRDQQRKIDRCTTMLNASEPFTEADRRHLRRNGVDIFSRYLNHWFVDFSGLREQERRRFPTLFCDFSSDVAQSQATLRQITIVQAQAIGPSPSPLLARLVCGDASSFASFVKACRSASIVVAAPESLHDDRFADSEEDSYQHRDSTRFSPSSSARPSAFAVAEGHGVGGPEVLSVDPIWHAALELCPLRNITSLTLSFCGLDDESCQFLCACIVGSFLPGYWNPSLASAGAGIGSAADESSAGASHSGKQQRGGAFDCPMPSLVPLLKCFDVSHNALSLPATVRAIHRVTVERRLHSLSVRGNMLSSGDGCTVYDILRDAPALHSLDVGFCRIEPGVLNNMVDFLPFMNTVKELNIDGAELTAKLAVDILQHVQTNVSIARLSCRFGGANCSAAFHQRLEQLLQRNYRQREEKRLREARRKSRRLTLAASMTSHAAAGAGGSLSDSRMMLLQGSGEPTTTGANPTSLQFSFSVDEPTAPLNSVAAFAMQRDDTKALGDDDEDDEAMWRASACSPGYRAYTTNEPTLLVAVSARRQRD